MQKIVIDNIIRGSRRPLIHLIAVNNSDDKNIKTYNVVKNKLTKEGIDVFFQLKDNSKVFTEDRLEIIIQDSPADFVIGIFVDCETKQYSLIIYRNKYNRKFTIGQVVEYVWKYWPNPLSYVNSLNSDDLNYLLNFYVELNDANKANYELSRKIV